MLLKATVLIYAYGDRNCPVWWNNCLLSYQRLQRKKKAVKELILGRSVLSGGTAVGEVGCGVVETNGYYVVIIVHHVVDFLTVGEKVNDRCYPAQKGFPSIGVIVLILFMQIG